MYTLNRIGLKRDRPFERVRDYFFRGSSDSRRVIIKLFPISKKPQPLFQNSVSIFPFLNDYFQRLNSIINIHFHILPHAVSSPHLAPSFSVTVALLAFPLSSCQLMSVGGQCCFTDPQPMKHRSSFFHLSPLFSSAQNQLSSRGFLQPASMQLLPSFFSPILILKMQNPLNFKQQLCAIFCWIYKPLL